MLNRCVFAILSGPEALQQSDGRSGVARFGELVDLIFEPLRGLLLGFLESRAVNRIRLHAAEVDVPSDARYLAGADDAPGLAVQLEHCAKFGFGAPVSRPADQRPERLAVSFFSVHTPLGYVAGCRSFFRR